MQQNALAEALSSISFDEVSQAYGRLVLGKAIAGFPYSEKATQLLNDAALGRFAGLTALPEVVSSAEVAGATELAAEGHSLDQLMSGLEMAAVILLEVAAARD